MSYQLHLMKSIKFLYTCMHEYFSRKDKTPLLCAAEVGHDEIVAHLLQFREVLTDLKEQPKEVHSASVSTNHVQNLCSHSFMYNNECMVFFG